jgi:hypothetical protein
MSTLKTNTLSNVAGTASTAIENAINGSAKAWVNFNAQGTVAIRASYNVSSITDDAAGQFTVNFTNPMPDTSYVTVLSGDIVTTTRPDLWYDGSLTTSLVRVRSYGSSSYIDLFSFSVAVFR